VKLLIDRSAVFIARRINSDRTKDIRTYYLVACRYGDAIVVTRHGLDLTACTGYVCDCLVGVDVAQEGFCREEDVGKQRPKITVIRILYGETPDETITSMLYRWLPPKGR
jgi:hypothetical protein